MGFKTVFNWIFFFIPGALLVMDLLLAGSGQWSEFLGFSFRKLMLLLLATGSSLMWVRSSSVLYTLIGILGLAIFAVGWSMMIPLFYNTPLPNALNDSQLFLGLLFAPAIVQTVIQTGCWPSALRLIERLIWILALLHIAIFWYQEISGDGAAEIILAMRSLLEPGRPEEETSVFIGPIADGFRVFWGSSVFLLLGIYLAVRNFIMRRMVLSIFIFLMISYAIHTTLTRGLILSIPLFFVLWWMFDLLLKWCRLGLGLYLLIGFALLIMTLPIILLADPNVLAAIGLGRDISDDLRYDQATDLIDAIVARPLFGGGFGGYVGTIRSEAAPWSYELSMLALYMKIGFFGVAVLLGVFVIFVHAAVVETSSAQFLPADTRRAISQITSLLFCVIFCSNTNPYIFSMLGWGFLMFIYIEFCVTTQQRPVAGALT